MMRARDNPFATERVLRLRYQFRELDGDPWPMLLVRLESLKYRAAVVGPHGSGKTTLLEDLGEQLIERGFRAHSVFLNEQNRAYPTEFVRRICRSLDSSDIILFDGCEQLGPLNWRRFCWQTRHAGGLVITTHSTGRLPLLRLCQTDPELLDDLVRRLIGVDSTSPTPSEIRRLYDAHRGNLRDALRELYDVAATSSAVPRGNHH